MFDLEGKRNDKKQGTYLDSVLTRTNHFQECEEDPSKPASEKDCHKEPDIFIDGKHYKILNSCKVCGPLVCNSNSTNNFLRWIESGIVSSSEQLQIIKFDISLSKRIRFHMQKL